MAESHLTILAPALEPEASRLLREVHEDLRMAGVACTPMHAGVVSSAKSGGSLTSLVVGGLVSAAGVRAMSQVLVAVVQRSAKRRIEVRMGDDTLIIDGASARDGRTALDSFLERAKTGQDA
ncbi:putative Abi (CAAX) family protease [Actinoplanes tereljensis]|uniref:Uncharacterized protein n=1 Tax=Paractinoplanes tereljensis TaxID=571912 RepID=A0A919NG61_9ACTN|nr:hypothetical protein [Actinoplanes tereljensis]GIF17372.1 hypothetical protein Ate02nite_01020 [Actinoplanes tereljensis]